MPTKSEAHNAIKFNAFLNSDSYELEPDSLMSHDKTSTLWKDKPTLSSCNGNMSTFRKEIRAFYQRREDKDNK